MLFFQILKCSERDFEKKRIRSKHYPIIFENCLTFFWIANDETATSTKTINVRKTFLKEVRLKQTSAKKVRLPIKVSCE